jgi:hypothetical protein
MLAPKIRPVRVKGSKVHNEHMFSELPQIADVLWGRRQSQDSLRPHFGVEGLSGARSELGR